jgi:hypothetical protein
MYKVTIPQPAIKPTPDEEMLKLDIIELSRKSQFSVYTLLDDVNIVMIKRRMNRSHIAAITKSGVSVNVSRINKDVPILEINPI